MLKMSVDCASMIFSLAFWVMYLAIGCKHPEVRYWPLLETTTIAMCSLPDPETECQRSVNNVWCYILGNLTGDWL